MQVAVASKSFNAFQYIVRENNFSCCKFGLAYILQMGKRNAKSTTFVWCNCSTAGCYKEEKSREVYPLHSNRW